MAHLQGREQQRGKKETSNVAYSMNKTWWSWSDDMTRTWYKDIDDVECHGVCVAYVYDIHEWINFVGMLQ
jgi:hypothetical protein